MQQSTFPSTNKNKLMTSALRMMLIVNVFIQWVHLLMVLPRTHLCESQSRERECVQSERVVIAAETLRDRIQVVLLPVS